MEVRAATSSTESVKDIFLDWRQEVKIEEEAEFGDVLIDVRHVGVA
jgi:hypothetical protein